MEKSKFEQMVREFPFMLKILAEQKLFANTIGDIKVARVDRNLLEITPTAWAHDVDVHGSHEGHRLFWVISPGESIQLNSAWSRSIPYERNDHNGAVPIGPQILALGRDPLFIVEIHAEGWDYEERIPHVVIYKMLDFEWRKHCWLAQLSTS